MSVSEGRRGFLMVCPVGEIVNNRINIAFDMILFPWQEKKLRTIWRVEKNGRGGLLVGTAHFSPYSFKKTLQRLIQRVETVIFEGPLDEESMADVARHGRRSEGTPSLYDALDPDVIRGINALLAPRSGSGTTAGSYLDFLGSRSAGFMEANARNVRPWMALFATWTAFLNWSHSMDMEAFQIAGKLGKRIEYLETIADQLATLDGIPFDRIVRYFNQYRSWNNHRDFFSRVYFAGDLESRLSKTGDFPTRCEEVIGRRDPIFFRGIRNAFQRGPAAAFIGIGHIPGVIQRFRADGCIIREEAC